MPRSTSRDLADRFLDPATGRRRRYFRDWTPVERWKIYFSRLAAAIVLGWAAVSFVGTKFNSQASHGPVASVHSAWDSQCDACHRDANNKGMLDAHARWNDFTCERCHAAPSHHVSIKPGDAVENCGSCHHEHGGKNMSLTKMSDDHCVRCHGESGVMLENKLARKGPANHPRSNGEVYATDFAKDHPEFPSLANHERSMKFSHSLHLTPGMVLASGAKDGWRLSDVPVDKREPYRTGGQRDDAFVQLDCKACHTLETNPASRAAGKYFQPIKYEMHCAACHPTTVPPSVTSRDTVVEAFAVPHGQQLSTLTATLEKEYSLRLQKDHPPLSKPPASNSKTAVDQAFTADVTATAARAKESLVKMSCLKCHPSNTIKIGENSNHIITDPAIPTIWLKSAKFDHTAHKGTACLQCHPNAVAKVENGLTVVNEREPVNIEGLKSCRECHSPQHLPDPGTSTDRIRGGIRFGCTDCHSYHNGDHPLEGRGAAAFFPKPMKLEDFLKGK